MFTYKFFIYENENKQNLLKTFEISAEEGLTYSVRKNFMDKEPLLELVHYFKKEEEDVLKYSIDDIESKQYLELFINYNNVLEDVKIFDKVITFITFESTIIDMVPQKTVIDDNYTEKGYIFKSVLRIG